MNAGALPAGLVPDSTYVEIDKLPWTATRFPGVESKTLMENKETGLATLLMRWAPGARLPKHEHVEIEQTYVISGSFSDHMGTCKAGDYVWRRGGSVHEAWSDEGCLMIGIFLKPNKFFD
ncbi:MAG: cupin domain-containing protein [Alphaproteobacteria bacterium]|nr:cupin domain-containing protein [Alphaproteobacteria bacterium]